MKSFKIDWLVIGSITKDKIFSLGQSIDKLGGVPMYGGLTLKQLGQSVAVCTRIRDEDRKLLRIIRENSIGLFIGYSRDTTSFHNYLDGNNRRQKMLASADTIGLDIVEKAIDEVCPDFVLLGPLHPWDISKDVFSFLGHSQCLVATDAQGLLRGEQNGWIEGEVSKNIDELLFATDWLKVSSEEIRLLKSVTKLNEIDIIEKYELKEIIITSSCRGGIIWSADASKVNFSAKIVENISDTTGAGDVFFSAYLVARVCMGKQLEESAKEAAIIAAEQVSGRHINVYL